MKYFKDQENKVFAYESDVIDQVAEYKAAPNRADIDEGSDEKCKEDFPEVIAKIAAQLTGLTEITEEEKDALLAPSEEEKTAAKAAAVRAERDRLLIAADVMIFRAEDTGGDTSSLRAYRQALRDVPQQEGFPWDVVWPENPEEGDSND